MAGRLLQLKAWVFGLPGLTSRFPVGLLVDLLVGIFVVRCGSRHAGIGFLVWLTVGLWVALPVIDHIVLEPDCEIALLFLAVAGQVQVGVVPAVGVAHLLQRGRTQDRTSVVWGKSVEGR